MGTWIIIALAALSAIAVALWAIPERSGMQFWTFANDHTKLYRPLIEEWNGPLDAQIAQLRADGADAERIEELKRRRLELMLISIEPLDRRLKNGFASDTPVPELCEVIVDSVGGYFSGPLEDVGFHDLSERLRSSGIADKINAPSLIPWSNRGRIFGLPHDVHPVALCYRSDLFAKAGINPDEIRTWSDFERLCMPLQDPDGDGRNDRYILNIWETNQDVIQLLILQAGGTFFNADGSCAIASPSNAKVISRIVQWITPGPRRMATDAREFDAAGAAMKVSGEVVCSFMPDWLAGVWRKEIKGLDGKVRIMPLPAWEHDPAQRRTSVMGGTMLGFPKRGRNFDLAWEYGRKLYFDRGIAQRLYEVSNIISPVKEFWTEPFYNAPAPYFGGQRIGAEFIRLAPQVPPRTSSPFNSLARARLSDAVNALKQYAVDEKIYEAAALEPRALELLSDAQRSVEIQMQRNIFLKKPEADFLGGFKREVQRSGSE